MIYVKNTALIYTLQGHSYLKHTIICNIQSAFYSVTRMWWKRIEAYFMWAASNFH